VGIVAVGKAGERAYVLRDASMKGSPNAWADAVCNVYSDLSADRVVAERNFGGDMVESTLRTADRNLPVEVISASRGKQQRAEPVAALYEQGKVSHAGTFQELETQMTTWDPANSSESPDRVDALVWALTELKLHNASESDVLFV
jgi:phage terminase large subunit-like protein